jgi:hypothetical protein
MLLAEALAERKQALKTVGEAEAALTAAAVIFKGDKNPSDPEELSAQLEQAILTFLNLSVRINLTNNKATITHGNGTFSLMEAVARREAMLLHIRASKRVLESVEEKVYGRSRYGGRRTKDEVKQIAQLDVAVLRKAIDDSSKELRELDMEIQKKNWTTELV